MVMVKLLVSIQICLSLFYFSFLTVYPIYANEKANEEIVEETKNSIMYSGTVVSVVDGDTIKIKCNIPYSSLEEKKLFENVTFTLRLADIDAPELKQDYGKESKSVLEKLLLNREITYIEDEKNDRYGRILATIFIRMPDKSNKEYNVNRLMVKNGYASCYSRSKKYKAEETFAKKNKIGLWKNTNVISPAEFRKRSRNKNRSNF